MEQKMRKKSPLDPDWILYQKYYAGAKGGPSVTYQNTFEVLYEKFKDKLYRFAYSIIENREDAKDIAQEVLVKVFLKKIKIEGKPRAKFGTLLYKITQNQCISHLRKIGTETKLIPYRLDEDIVDDEGEPTTRHDVIKDEKALTPSEELEKKERKEAVRNALAKLPEKYQSVILDRFFAEMEYPDIAKKHGLSIQKAKDRIYYALELLKKILGFDFNL